MDDEILRALGCLCVEIMVLLGKFAGVRARFEC